MSPVNENKVIINIIHISEKPFVIIDKLTRSNLLWETFIENFLLIASDNNNSL